MIKLKVKENRPLFKRKCDNYGNKLRRKKVINYLRRELQSSTTHGLPYIVKEEIHSVERVFWAVNFLFCSGLVIYLLTAQYVRLAETPVVMSLEMDYFDWNVSYPAFTLCPMVKPDAEAIATFVNKTNMIAGKNLETYIWAIASTNMNRLQHFEIKDDFELIKPKDYAKIASDMFMIFKGSMTTNTNRPISLEKAMTEHGMCHVINSNVAKFHNPSKWNNSIGTMPYTKNNIELSVYDKDFFTQIMNYADSYEVFIHSPDEILGTTYSYTISDQGFTSYGVQVQSTKISDVLRLAPIRLRKCRFINESNSKRYSIYTYNHCMLECRINMILKLCDCVPHFYKSLDHERVCSLGELKCVLNYKKEIMTLSTSTETLSQFRNTDGLPRSSRDCNCLSNCETDMYLKDVEKFIPEANMNRLRIGISSFPNHRIVKDFIFSFVDIMLKIGGVLNLCIGSSVLSIVEFLLIFIRIPIYRFVQMLKRKFIQK